MLVTFQSDFQKKLLSVSFEKETVLAHASDVETWRKLWMQELKSWHSPYKAIVDCSRLRIRPNTDVRKALDRMFDFLSRFFLKKAAGWGSSNGEDRETFPFETFATEAEALAALGIREGVRRNAGDDFRSIIHLDNHFEQQVVELSFSEPVILNKERLAILKSKLTNNLMQWHSSWNLLVDAANLEISQEVSADFEAMIRFFKGFFLKDMVAYHPLGKGKSFPFTTFRSRHRASDHLKSNTSESGREANCTERKGEVTDKYSKGK